MKQILIACALAGLAATSASHAEPLEFTGEILVGNPAPVGGLTVNGAPCDPANDLNGLDAVWFSIADTAGLPVVLTATGDNAAASDVDAHFYTASCAYIDDTSMAQGFLGEVEQSTVPAQASFVSVEGFAGAAMTFTLTIG